MANTVNQKALDAAVRKAAMDALERGARAGASYLVAVLRSVVMRTGGSAAVRKPGGGGVSPFKYRRKTKGGARWEKNPIEWSGAGRMREGPPAYRTGAGYRSIVYEFIERNDAAGYIKLRIGGDAIGSGTKGGFHTLAGYMAGHEFGVRYPTRGPMKGSTGVVQRPWLYKTVKQYFPVFERILASIAGGR